METEDTMHSYLWEGKKKTSHGFQCTLMSTQDPSQYILADSHGQGMTEQTTKALLDKNQARICVYHEHCGTCGKFKTDLQLRTKDEESCLMAFLNNKYLIGVAPGSFGEDTG